jgi:hypothetical protein
MGNRFDEKSREGIVFKERKNLRVGKDNINTDNIK